MNPPRFRTATPPALLMLAAVLAGAGCRTPRPPVEAGPFRTPDLVELADIDPILHLNIRYATPDNLVHRAVYRQPRAFLQRPAAEALVRAHRRLAVQGYGIVVFDGYRPWSVTRLFWDLTPPENRAFVAPPDKGSRHNRGCAVDCTLYDLRTGADVPMPSEFDETTERAHSTYPGGTAGERHARDLLRSAMEAEGFRCSRTNGGTSTMRTGPRTR